LGVSRKWSSILDSGLFATMKWIFKSGFFLRDSVTWQSRWWQSRERFWFFKMLQGEWPVTLGAKSIRSEVVTFEQFTDDRAMTSLTGPRDVISGYWPAKSWISLVKVSIFFWFYCGWDALTPKFYKVSSPQLGPTNHWTSILTLKNIFVKTSSGRLKSFLLANQTKWPHLSQSESHQHNVVTNSHQSGSSTKRATTGFSALAFANQRLFTSPCGIPKWASGKCNLKRELLELKFWYCEFVTVNISVLNIHQHANKYGWNERKYTPWFCNQSEGRLIKVHLLRGYIDLLNRSKDELFQE